MNQNNLELKIGLKSSTAHQLAVTEYGSRMVLMEILKDRPAAKEALSKELKKNQEG